MKKINKKSKWGLVKLPFNFYKGAYEGRQKGLKTNFKKLKHLQETP